MGKITLFINTDVVNMEFLSEKHYDIWGEKKKREQSLFSSFLEKK